jgi:[CysO sulfur-carrier protein]-thiocarboxylate-dependent cysteine synthase
VTAALTAGTPEATDATVAGGTAVGSGPAAGSGPAFVGRFGDILGAIGHTPMVGIQSLSPDPGVRLLAKLEGTNPTGSVKDRIALALIDDLERRGLLAPGKVLLEPTSGNTGIALALVATRRGIPLTLVMPDNVSPERKALARAFGAEIIETPGGLGSNGAVAHARALAAMDDRFVLADQYRNDANPRAHERTTGPEILAQCPEIDVFVAGLGTSGTLMGVARYLRRAKPSVRVVAAEPLPGAGVDALRSLDDGFVPEIFDPSLLDRKLLVSNREALIGMRALLRQEGIFAGLSSGAVVAVARRVARELPGSTIVALLPDGGWKYLAAGIHAGDLDAVEADLDASGTMW